MRIFKSRLALAAATLLAATALTSSAQAAVFDNFDSETPGTPQPNLTNWTVTGTVDIVDTNTFNDIDCLGDTGRCLDIDGTTGPGLITSKASISYEAGELVSLKFYASGNQRVGGVDDLYAGFILDSFQDITRSSGGAFGTFSSGPVNKIQFQLAGTASGEAFQLYTLSFTSASAGSARAFIGTNSADNVGAIIDNVSFGVPEPATWAMMLLGFGGMGAVLRRRRAAAYA